MERDGENSIRFRGQNISSGLNYLSPVFYKNDEGLIKVHPGIPVRNFPFSVGFTDTTEASKFLHWPNFSLFFSLLSGLKNIRNPGSRSSATTCLDCGPWCTLRTKTHLVLKIKLNLNVSSKEYNSAMSQRTRASLVRSARAI